MQSITLDAIDLQLLDLLQHDAAQSNQALAERVHVSPPTCLRRVKRLHDVGLIERQVALLQPDRLAAVQGHGLACIVEVSLDRQSAEALDAFEARAVADAEVQQCWRVSPEPLRQPSPRCVAPRIRPMSLPWEGFSHKNSRMFVHPISVVR